AKWQSARRAARGQEKLVKRVDLPLIVGHGLLLHINGYNRPPEMDVHLVLVCMPPDAVQRFASPELFAQWRPVVRWIRFRRDYCKARVNIQFANSGRGRIGSHPAPNDQIFVISHITSFSLLSWLPVDAVKLTGGATTWLVTALQ